jgi:hypothetical protein
MTGLNNNFRMKLPTLKLNHLSYNHSVLCMMLEL